MNTTARRWIWMVAAAAVLCAGCGSANGPATASLTSTPSPSSLASSSASPTLCGSATRCLALVTLQGSSQVVVRDVTDINNPKTVSNLGSIPAPVFVSATEISYAEDTNLFRAPLIGAPRTLVTSQGGAGTWSPDGTAVLYTTSTDQQTVTVHELKAGQDHVLGTVPGGGAGGCETIASCQIPNFLDFQLLFSPDGTMVSLVTTGFTGSSMRVWSADGALLASSDSYGPTMSVWSGPSLYFRDSKGVEVWHGGVLSPFLLGVQWIKPKASAGHGQIVYVARDSAGWSHTYVVDTATKKVRELNAARSEPVVFLNTRYIWYGGERACVPSDACGPTPPLHPSNGKTYIYDLETGTEYGSIITAVYDVWPHPA